MKRLLFLLCWLAGVSAMAQQATVREISQSIKTYPFGDPNPIAEPSRSIYPYFRFDGFSAKGVDQEWKVVELENPFIKVTLLPQVGGKIWGAIDKTTNREFVYQNSVMKFRDIAMRGPWTSGGIEFNFGIIGHVPTTSTPVDYLTRQKDDGSVSCYISSYEWVTHTWWTVEVNVPADKAYFTTHTIWHNSSDLDQPYYQWMNAGYQAAGNAEFTYPGTNYIGHGGELRSFPIDEQGHKIGWYEANNFGGSASYHVLGKYNDFYGVYWHDNGFGSIHYADYSDKLGMKIFLWGMARSGAIWEDLLTDTDGQYIELQSGRMFNQPSATSGYTPYKHTSFAPQATDEWTEYWFPVENIGGVLKANNFGALNVKREGNQLKVSFSPLQKLNTEMALYDGKTLIGKYPLQTEVLKVWEKTIPMTGSLQNEGTLKVVIGDQDLVYSENPADNILQRPKKSPADFDWNSAHGLFIKGDQLLNQKMYVEAERSLKACLEKEPYFLSALTSLASLYYHEGKFTEALDLCKKALAVHTYDGKANYLYGLCNQVLGHQIDAMDGFSIASRTMDIRSAAYDKLAEMYVAAQNLNKAASFAKSALEYNVHNLSAKHLLMVIGRLNNKSEKSLIEQVMKEAPLYHPVRYEAYKAGMISKDSFTEAIRNELLQEVYIEMADIYERIGCVQDAMDILAMVDNYPIANYKRAYLMDKQGNAQGAKALLEKANSQSPALVFPHRATTLKALEYAEKNTQSWKPTYYQALVYWANQQSDKALELMEACKDVDYGPFYLSRATLKKGDAKLADLKKAESLDKSWRNGFALINHYIDTKQWKEADAVGKKYMKWYPESYVIGLKHARVLSELGQDDKSLKLLNGLMVLPNEGASAGRVVYRTAHLNRAVKFLNENKVAAAKKEIEASTVWPENLGVGKPFDHLIDTRIEDYLEAEAYSRLGDKEKAAEYYRKVADYRVEGSYFRAANLLNALSLKALGQQQEADEMVKGWGKNERDLIAQCCIAVYQGDKQKVATLMDNYRTPVENAPWETSRRDNDFELLMNLFAK